MELLEAFAADGVKPMLIEKLDRCTGNLLVRETLANSTCSRTMPAASLMQLIFGPRAHVSFVDRLDTPRTKIRKPDANAYPAVRAIPSQLVDLIWWRRLELNLRPTDMSLPTPVDSTYFQQGTTAKCGKLGQIPHTIRTQKQSEESDD